MLLAARSLGCSPLVWSRAAFFLPISIVRRRDDPAHLAHLILSLPTWRSSPVGHRILFGGSDLSLDLSPANCKPPTESYFCEFGLVRNRPSHLAPRTFRMEGRPPGRPQLAFDRTSDSRRWRPTLREPAVSAVSREATLKRNADEPYRPDRGTHRTRRQDEHRASYTSWNFGLPRTVGGSSSWATLAFGNYVLAMKTGSTPHQ